MYLQIVDEIFPLTVKEIVEAQKADPILKHLFKSNAVLSKVNLLKTKVAYAMKVSS